MNDAVEWLIVKTSCGIQSIHAVSLQCGLACDGVDCSIVKTSCGTQSIYVASLQCGSACDAVDCTNSENFLWHSEHSCCFSKVWVSMWPCRVHNC